MRKHLLKLLLILLFLILIFLGVLFYRTGATFSVISISEKSFWEQVSSLFRDDKNKNRLDILLMGIRGGKDENGGLLTDEIMLISIEKNKKKAAVISIPRDLAVEIPELNEKKKINYAYYFGEKKQKRGGLLLAKALVSDITGIDIDYAILVDFESFEQIIDWVDGIDIYLEKPFEEKLQWIKDGKEESEYWIKNETGWSFFVPAGQNHLDGETALYYARSRFSTSDFDRSRRQQQILIAVKNKVLALNILQQPDRIFDFFSIIEKNIQTDMELGDIKELLAIAWSNRGTPISNIVLDTSENGLLLEGHMTNGSFVLLPKAGDWSEIRNLAGNIFTD